MDDDSFYDERGEEEQQPQPLNQRGTSTVLPARSFNTKQEQQEGDNWNAVQQEAPSRMNSGTEGPSMRHPNGPSNRHKQLAYERQQQQQQQQQPPQSVANPAAVAAAAAAAASATDRNLHIHHALEPGVVKANKELQDELFRKALEERRSRRTLVAPKPEYIGMTADHFINFSTFAAVCETVVFRCPGPPLQRRATFDKLFDIMLQTRRLTQRTDGEDLYPIVRLLAADIDRRRLYQIKELRLAEAMIRIFAIPDSSPDANELRTWRNPNQHTFKHGTNNQGQFSELLVNVMARRGLRKIGTVENSNNNGAAAAAASSGTNLRKPEVYTGSTVTIAEVNEALEKLTRCCSSSRDEVAAILRPLVADMSLTELRWLVRIILKSMNLRSTPQVILDWLHPECSARYNQLADLAVVCRSCFNAEALQRLSEDPHSVAKEAQTLDAICFGRAFVPMLADNVDKRALEKFLDSNGTVLAEPKWDGQRLVVHVDLERRTAQYFQRSTRETTGGWHEHWHGVLFGGAIDKRTKTLIPLPAIKTPEEGSPAWKNFIIDCEGVCFNPNTHGGRAKETAMNFDGWVSGGSWGCLYVFDLLFLNGESLMSRPLGERKDLLFRVLRPIPERIEIVMGLQVRTWRDAILEMDRQVTEYGREGCVLKSASHRYTCGQRKDWIKLKIDHISGIAETVDLVVLGVFRGPAFGREDWDATAFLVGVWAGGNFDDVDCHKAGAAVDWNSRRLRIGGWNRQHCVDISSSPDAADAQWLTVGVIGTGYSCDELRAMNSMIDQHKIPCTRYPSKSGPEWLLQGGWSPPDRERPDFYIQPTKSFVIECLAYSLNPASGSSGSTFGYTLQFPRMKRIRTDRSPLDATNAADLIKTIARCGSHGVLRQMTVEDFDKLKTNKDEKRESRYVKKQAQALPGGSQLRVQTFDPLQHAMSLSDEVRAVKTQGVFAGLEIAILTFSEDTYQQQRILGRSNNAPRMISRNNQPQQNNTIGNGNGGGTMSNTNSISRAQSFVAPVGSGNSISAPSTFGGAAAAASQSVVTQQWNRNINNNSNGNGNSMATTVAGQVAETQRTNSHRSHNPQKSNNNKNNSSNDDDEPIMTADGSYTDREFQRRLRHARARAFTNRDLSQLLSDNGARVVTDPHRLTTDIVLANVSENSTLQKFVNRVCYFRDDRTGKRDCGLCVFTKGDERTRLSTYLRASAGTRDGPNKTADILHVDWALRCIASNSLVFPNPQGEILYAGRGLTAALNERYDEFKDAYFEDATVQSLNKSRNLVRKHIQDQQQQQQQQPRNPQRRDRENITTVQRLDDDDVSEVDVAALIERDSFRALEMLRDWFATEQRLEEDGEQQKKSNAAEHGGDESNNDADEDDDDASSQHSANENNNNDCEDDF